MKLTFLGACHEVTGSLILLEAAGKKIVIGNYSGEFLLCYDGKEFCFANLFHNNVQNFLWNINNFNNVAF